MINKIARPWREAASVILASRASRFPEAPNHGRHPEPALLGEPQVQQLTTKFDYKILFLKRHSANTFFANSEVFPGGAVDEADFNINWMQVFGKVGVKSRDDFSWKSNELQPRPPWKESDPNSLPNDVAYRISAIREAFEEAGILLVTKSSEISDGLKKAPDYDSVYMRGEVLDLDKEKLLGWQRDVYNDAGKFWSLCMELDVVPNIWSLFEWSNFITPIRAKKRYNTVNYLSTLTHIPGVILDNHEMADYEWLSPSEAINKRLRRESNLTSPQEYESLRLMNMPTIESIESYGNGRMNRGTEANFSVVAGMKDCVIEIYPGDDMFPEDFDPEGFGDYTIDETEEDNRKRCKKLHRLIHGGAHAKSFYCNVELPCGQMAPQELYTYDMGE